MIIIIPLPLFFAQTIYGVRGFEAWVVIGIIWTFCSAITVVIYPLYESREALTMVSRGIIKVRLSFKTSFFLDLISKPMPQDVFGGQGKYGARTEMKALA